MDHDKLQPHVLARKLAAARALAAAWSHMAFGRRAFFKPEAMVHILRIPPGVQQDSGEFLGSFLNYVQDVAAAALRGRECASVLALRDYSRLSIIKSNTCLKCGKVSQNEEEHRVLVSRCGAPQCNALHPREPQ